jgi:xanthine dehydrogenase molybdopterin-binding subunit B
LKRYCGISAEHLLTASKTLRNPTRDSKDKLMNILPGNMRFGAGQPVKRLEDQRLLTGKRQFIDDRPEDGALWLHVLRSPHAHARMVSIDTKAAAAMPGVEAVYTGADLVADDIGTLPTLAVFQRPDGSPMTVPPRRLLAHEIVRFAGEPVAAVVAASRIAAQTAAERSRHQDVAHAADADEGVASYSVGEIDAEIGTSVGDCCYCEHYIDVIPGRGEVANPESRSVVWLDSGFARFTRAPE